MICQGYNENDFCITRNIGPVKTKDLFCRICQAKGCIHRQPTDHVVKCKTCNGAKYIYCKVKKLKINQNLCNSACQQYKGQNAKTN